MGKVALKRLEKIRRKNILKKRKLTNSLLSEPPIKRTERLLGNFPLGAMGRITHLKFLLACGSTPKDLLRYGAPSAEIRQAMVELKREDFNAYNRIMEKIKGR